MLKFIFFVATILFIQNWSLVIMNLMVISSVWFLMTQNFNLTTTGGWLHIDTWSLYLILLSFWVIMLVILVSDTIEKNNNNWNYFVGLSMFMLICLMMSFSCSDLLSFYLFFEASLIPIFLMVLGWGYQPERIRASLYLLFYTLTASLPLLLGILFCQYVTGTNDYCVSFNSEVNLWLYLCMILAFMVKMPIYLVHLWLPKAHVEAPTGGSMVLAGVLLKLGGYGIMRVFSGLYFNTLKMGPILMVVSMLGALSSCFVCLRQVDMKLLVAYSSVAHMALVFVGFLSMKSLGWSGAYIIMVAHGLCSSALFALVGVFYSRSSTRSIILMRGLISISPLFSFWWFIFSIFNMAAPPSLNLLGEVMVFIISLNWLGEICLMVGLVSFMSAAYSLFLFSGSQQGSFSLMMNSWGDANCKEHFFLIVHLVFLLVSVFLFSEILI